MFFTRDLCANGDNEAVVTLRNALVDFADVLNGRIGIDEAAPRLEAVKPAAPFSNGFYHGQLGYTWNGASAI